MIIRLLVGERGVVKMLNKLFARGTGRGSGPVDYVISKTDPATGQPRLPPPEVLRGDPEITRALIDSLDFKHKYTSGVLSFAPEDLPTHTQQALVMTAFEKSAFAGLDQSRYNILWVRHTHTETGRVELHYVTPRVELTTGKSLNIAPPGRKSSEGKPLPPKLFDDLVDYFNLKYNWARPDDPKRKRIFSPGNNALITKANLRQGAERSTTPKQIISDFLSQQIELGLIEDRNDVVTVLKEAGFLIPRQGKDYITVVDEQTQTRHRLKGGIYEQDFSITATLGSEKSAGSHQLTEINKQMLATFSNNLSELSANAINTIERDMGQKIQQIKLPLNNSLSELEITIAKMTNKKSKIWIVTFIIFCCCLGIVLAGSAMATTLLGKRIQHQVQQLDQVETQIISKQRQMTLMGFELIQQKEGNYIKIPDNLDTQHLVTDKQGQRYLKFQLVGKNNSLKGN